jgi:hypothetical protein
MKMEFGNICLMWAFLQDVFNGKGDNALVTKRCPFQRHIAFIFNMKPSKVRFP